MSLTQKQTLTLAPGAVVLFYRPSDGAIIIRTAPGAESLGVQLRGVLYPQREAMANVFRAHDQTAIRELTK